MHLAVVTNYSADGRANGEYGWHLVQGLRQARPQARVTVLAGRPGPPGDGVRRDWRYSSIWVAHDILAGVRRLSPDAVLVNTSFNSWGHRVANLAGFWAIRQLARRLPTMALVHYLPQTVPPQAISYRLNPLDWLGIDLACRCLAGAQTVGFTLERDRDYFSRCYHHPRTLQVEHGLLGDCVWSAPPVLPTILVFGYWGPGKDLEVVLQACLAQNRRLIVAGSSHPRFPGYLESLRARYSGPNLDWRGYVPESEVGRTFREASLVLLPYHGDTGTSGVLHLACQYGRAILAADVGVLREESARLGVRASFYAKGELGERLGLADDHDLLSQMGAANLKALAHLSPARVAESHWRELDRLVGSGLAGSRR